jgi:hypothetical protein
MYNNNRFTLEVLVNNGKKTLSVHNYMMPSDDMSSTERKIIQAKPNKSYKIKIKNNTVESILYTLAIDCFCVFCGEVAGPESECRLIKPGDEIIIDSLKDHGNLRFEKEVGVIGCLYRPLSQNDDLNDLKKCDISTLRRNGVVLYYLSPNEMIIRGIKPNPFDYEEDLFTPLKPFPGF